MGIVLFYLKVICVGLMVVHPLFLAKYRGAALFGWLGELSGTVVFALLKDYVVPDYLNPAWSYSNLWTIIYWTCCVAGFIIAVCKPSKETTLRV